MENLYQHGRPDPGLIFLSPDDSFWYNHRSIYNKLFSAKLQTFMKAVLRRKNNLKSIKLEP
jgi:hypothetical protein